MGRSFGTGRSLVSEDPPKADRFTSSSTCRATPSAPATARAACISWAWRCPYCTVSAYSANPSRRAIAAAVYESRPPLSRTTALPLDDARGTPELVGGLDSTRRRVPDVLVKLQLDPHGQVVREHPLRQRPRVHDAVHGREVDRRGARREAVPHDDVAGVLVVRAILDDELHLVLRTKAVEVAPVVFRGLAAAGALHVEDGDDAVGDAGRAAMASGLEEHRPPAFEQLLHQRIHILLQQRLAAGHLDERTRVRVQLLEHVIERALRSFVEGVRRVAPRAPEVAGGQANEDTRPPGVARFALDGVENLVDGQHAGIRDPGCGIQLPMLRILDPRSRIPDCKMTAWARCASVRRAGITRPAREPGTACSIRRPVRSAPEPTDSTSCVSTPSTSIRSR